SKAPTTGVQQHAKAYRRRPLQPISYFGHSSLDAWTFHKSGQEQRLLKRRDARGCSLQARSSSLRAFEFYSPLERQPLASRRSLVPDAAFGQPAVCTRSLNWLMVQVTVIQRLEIRDHSATSRTPDFL